MAIRDAVVLNTTASRLETQQGSDTVRIKANSSEILSIENTSQTSVFSVNTSDPGITISGDFTASGDFSGSLSTTASFGEVNVTTLVGSAAELTNTDKPGTISGSAQLFVSGAFNQGFEFTGTISGSSTSTGSFGIISGSTIIGDGSQLTNRTAPKFVSSSGVIAVDISGSFDEGFEYTGTISGSSTSTGSFGILSAGVLVGDGSRLTNVTPDSSLSGSEQLASEISGAFDEGFKFTGTISGSSTTTGSFGVLSATKLVSDGSALTNSIPLNVVSSSVQIASDISGSHTSGFSYSGTISGSSTTTGSFGKLSFETISADGSLLTNTLKPGVVSSSAQISADISGSFTKGFQLTGDISGSSTSTGSFGRLEVTSISGDASLLTNAVPPNTVSGSAQLATDISGSFIKGFEISGSIANPPILSGSFNATASFTAVFADTICGDASTLTNCRPETTVSASSVIASEISGAFDEGFAFDGNITPVPSTWALGGAMIETMNLGAGFGSQNAAAAMCNNKTEEYGGDSWSANPNTMITARECLYGVGTQTAGLIFGGETVPAGGISDKTELYNGTNFADRTVLNQERKALAGAGTAAAAIAFGGGEPALSNKSEEFDGGTPGSWSEGSEMGTARCLLGGAGSQNAALAIGGKAPAYSTATEEYNGTSWTSTTALPTARACLASVGTQNSTIVFGGNVDGSTILDTTVEYDGISYASRGSLITAVQKHSGAGSNEAGLSFGGGPVVKCTEEYQAATITSASFGKLIADTLKPGDISQLTNVYFGSGVISGSAQIQPEVVAAIESNPSIVGNIKTAVGVWSTGGNLNVAKKDMASAGTQNAALSAGGATGNHASANAINQSEEYNGDNWTEGDNLISARARHTGVGTQGAALFYGGFNTCTCTEEYNGTSYATGGTLSQGGYNKIGFGIQNAAFSTAGTYADYNGVRAESEQYDGASWSDSVSMITPRMVGGAGSVNAGIASYGLRALPQRALNCTELWDGTSWTEVSEAVTSGESGQQYGTQNSFAVTAGQVGTSPYNDFNTSTQFFDGIAYTVDANLNTGAYGRSAARPAQDSGIAFGGNNPSFLTETEEYLGYPTTGSFGMLQSNDLYIKKDKKLRVSSSYQIPSFISDPVTGSLVTGANASVGISGSEGDTSKYHVGEIWYNSTDNKLKFTYGINAWKAGGAMILARQYVGGAGTVNAALAIGGTVSTSEAETEEYNGAAWSAGGDLNTARWGLAASGLQNSALAFGGKTPSPAVTHHETEAYNGSSWSEVNDLIVGRGLHAGFGTQNAALAAAGYEHSPAAELNDTEEWNGTNWAAAADNNRTDRKVFGAGTQNAGIIFGGSNYTAPTHTMHAFTETYDGTTWTERNDMNAGRGVHAGAGTQNAAIAFGGQTEAGSNQTSATEEWNGTSWSVVNSMGTARRNLGGAGTQAAALAFAGGGPTTTGATECYSVKFIATACK
tara:strand:- start:20948 stop:25315 length:4368 start_codon:yes stop_codon:yes gene_type:complete